MTAFFSLFTAVLIIVTAALLMLQIASRLRGKEPGCRCNHHSVTYKGEKIVCPSCKPNKFRKEHISGESGLP